MKWHVNTCKWCCTCKSEKYMAYTLIHNYSYTQVCVCMSHSYGALYIFWEISHPTHGCKEDGGRWAREKKCLEPYREAGLLFCPFHNRILWCHNRGVATSYVSNPLIKEVKGLTPTNRTAFSPWVLLVPENLLNFMSIQCSCKVKNSLMRC